MTNNTQLPVWDHIDELRGRIIKSLIVLVLASFIFYYFVDQWLYFIIKPIGQLVFTSPADAFVARLMLTILGGFIFSLPFVLYQLWSFVALGLKDTERKYVLLYAPLSLVFFLLGVSFAYFIALPLSVQFLLGFANQWLVPMITIKSYISFFVTMVLSFGVIFELPIVLIFLTAIGIATPAFLSQKRRHAIIIILIVSAVITPPDIITLFILSVPLVILYELGVLASRLTYQRKLLVEK